MKRVYILLFLFLVSFSLNAGNVLLGNFENGTLGDWKTWGAPLSVVDNPSLVGNNSVKVALLDQSAGGWSGMALWSNTPIQDESTISIKVDVYFSIEGTLKLQMDNSIDGAPNIEKYENNIPANTWTTVEFILPTDQTVDHKQIAFQASIAGLVHIDNIYLVKESQTPENLVLGTFEGGSLQNWSTWGAPLSVVANPNLTGNTTAKVALLDQTGGGWSGMSYWKNEGILSNQYVGVSVDVYFETLGGTLKLQGDNSLSGAANIEKFINDIPIATWTKVVFDISDIALLDYKQIAFQSGAATKIYFDNITLLTTLEEEPQVEEIIIARETFGSMAYDTNNPTPQTSGWGSGTAWHWNWTDVTSFTSTNGYISTGSDSSIRINNYSVATDRPWADASGDMHVLMTAPEAYAGSWDTLFYRNITITGHENLVVAFGYAKRDHNAPKSEAITGMNVEIKIDNGQWVQLDTTLFPKPLAYSTWKWVELPLPANLKGNKMDVRFANYYNQGTLDDITIKSIKPKQVEPVESFEATANFSNRINLNWVNNNANKNVIIAYTLNNIFGEPESGKTYDVSSLISGGGTVIYSGDLDQFEHTGLSPNRTIYYKIWALSGTQYSLSLEASAKTHMVEPSQHASLFKAEALSVNSIKASWTDGAGTNLAEGYLLFINTDLAALPVPVDGTIYETDADASDGVGAVKINRNAQSYTWQNLSEGTTYYLSIYPYSNSELKIDYKTVGAPTATIATPIFVEKPAILPAAGEYQDSVWVKIISDIEDAEIFYTLNGTNPTSTSLAYTDSFKISESTLVKAIAIKSNNLSEITQSLFTLTNTPITVYEPIISPETGTYADMVTVSITCATPGAEIYYTLDGSDPSALSSSYSQPLIFTATTTVKAIAVLGDLSSSISESVFNIEITPIEVAAPEFSLPAGKYAYDIIVALSTTTAGATIFYTTNGEVPTNQSTPYTEELELSATTTIKAIAFKQGFYSNVSAITYSIEHVVLPTAVNTIAELRNSPVEGTTYILKGKATVTHVGNNGRHIFVQDESGAILIDNQNKKLGVTVARGNQLSNITGNLFNNQGMLEFIPVEGNTSLLPAAVYIPTPAKITVQELKSNFKLFESELIQLTKVQFQNEGIFSTNADYILAENENTVVMLTFFEDANYIGTTIPNSMVNITAIAIWENAEANIVPRDAGDIEEIVSVSNIQSDIKIFGTNQNVVIEKETAAIGLLTIYSLTGQKVLSKEINTNRTFIKIEHPGIYLFSYSEGNKMRKTGKVNLH
jgi:hypothetical protein